MPIQQKALIVHYGPGSAHRLDELNIQLSRGWRVVHTTPMGAAALGAGGAEPAVHFAALVIVERTQDNDAAVLEQEAEEEIDEIIEDLVEGDGSSVEVDDEPFTAREDRD